MLSRLRGTFWEGEETPRWRVLYKVKVGYFLWSIVYVSFHDDMKLKKSFNSNKNPRVIGQYHWQLFNRIQTCYTAVAQVNFRMYPSLAPIQCQSHIAKKKKNRVHMKGLMFPAHPLMLVSFYMCVNIIPVWTSVNVTGEIRLEGTEGL